MKRTICIAMALALMASLFVGCGCQNVSQREDGMITDPTGLMPSITTNPTHETTRPTMTTPTTEVTRPTETHNAMDDINGGATAATEHSAATAPSDGSAPSDVSRGRGRMDGRS